MGLLLATCATAALTVQATQETYVRWSSSDADRIGRFTYRQGRGGGIWDTRVLKTERRVAQLVVRIYDKEGKVQWPVPASLIRR